MEECAARLTELGYLDGRRRGGPGEGPGTALEHRGKALGMPMPEPDDEEGRVYAS